MTLSENVALEHWASISDHRGIVSVFILDSTDTQGTLMWYPVLSWRYGKMSLSDELLAAFQPANVRSSVLVGVGNLAAQKHWACISDHQGMLYVFILDCCFLQTIFPHWCSEHLLSYIRARNWHKEYTYKYFSSKKPYVKENLGTKCSLNKLTLV